uniref:Dirigent protein n=1 Tax=Oryza punctata TaxID=4537 RepID=A0A0E0LND7_ORYPU
MSPMPSLLLVFLVASSAAGVAAAGGELKHIHLYMHETFSGPNATEGGIVASPFNSTFGQVAVFDNELRRRQGQGFVAAGGEGFIVGTGKSSPGYLTSATVAFTAGEFNGSTLSVEGPFFSFADTAERSIVGGTGKLRLARGYYLLKLLGRTSPETAASPPANTLPQTYHMRHRRFLQDLTNPYYQYHPTMFPILRWLLHPPLVSAPFHHLPYPHVAIKTQKTLLLVPSSGGFFIHH